MNASKLAGSALLWVSLVCCGAEQIAPDDAGLVAFLERPRPPLIVVTMDTTRADHLSCYGYPNVTSPRLDERAKTALRFGRAYAPMGQTLPSHASLFTGLSPREHGLTDNSGRLPATVATLAERLSAAGYQTAGFVSSAVLDPWSGIARGFEFYEASKFKGSRRPGLERDAKAVTNASLSWLAQRDDDRPLFLWVHYMDPHWPLEAPELPMEDAALRSIELMLIEKDKGVAEARLDHDGVAESTPDYAPKMHSLRMATHWGKYDSEIRYMDHHMGRMLDGLDALGLLDPAVLLVAGDHGEGLFDHGEGFHGVNLFDELLRVPLLLWTPGNELAGEVVPEPVGLAALHNVMLHLALGDESGLQDDTMWSALLRDGRPRREPVFLERPYYSAEQLAERSGDLDPQRYVEGDMLGVVADELKFISEPGGREFLFDLSDDPGELVNLVEQRPEDVSRLRSLLDDWRQDNPIESAVPNGQISDERRQALQQLGYGH